MVTVVTVFFQFGGEVWERRENGKVQRGRETVTSATDCHCVPGHPRTQRKSTGKRKEGRSSVVGG